MTDDARKPTTDAGAAEMGDGPAAYAALAAAADRKQGMPSAKDFYVEQAANAEAAKAYDLAHALNQHAARSGNRIWPGPDSESDGPFGASADEDQARQSLDYAIRAAIKYIVTVDSGNDREGSSSTLADLRINHPFDQAVLAELMTIFGSQGRQLGEPVSESGEFETTTFETGINGLNLRTWRHADGRLQKVYLARSR